MIRPRDFIRKVRMNEASSFIEKQTLYRIRSFGYDGIQ